VFLKPYLLVFYYRVWKYFTEKSETISNDYKLSFLYWIKYVAILEHLSVRGIALCEDSVI